MEQLEDDLQPEMRYVAFCDVLGFSIAVENRFDATIALYAEFMRRMKDWPFPVKAKVSVYSDSIVVVSEELPAVLHAVQSLWFATLSQDWLIRGGIAYGRYWEKKVDGNLFVVSDALVRAVRLESTVKVPAITISPEVELTIAAWVPRFEHGIFQAPVLHFRGLSLVNPFNSYWFASARMRVAQMLAEAPQHAEKYEWFLALADAVEGNDVLVPQEIVDELLEKGILAPIGAPAVVAADGEAS
jgi:hypothetical protein